MLVTPSRRGFLGGLAASLFAAPAIVRATSLMPLRGAALPPDFIIPQRTVDVAFSQPLRGNSLLTINQITREAVQLWSNSNKFLFNLPPQYDEAFATPGAQIGTSLRIRLPDDFTVRETLMVLP